LVDASKAKKTYLESLRDLAGKRVDHSERAVRLAQAELDEAQFNALERNDPQQAAALKETREKYAARVAEEKAQVSKIDADLAEKRTEAQRKYDAWLQLERRLKSPGRQGTVPPPPRG
jgi:hypothetical protein